MPKLIDKDKFFAMKLMGFTNTEIARRLGCSTRQITRLCKGLVMDKAGLKIKDGDVESALREFFKSFESGEKAGARFGLTRQAVLK